MPFQKPSSDSTTAIADSWTRELRLKPLPASPLASETCPAGLRVPHYLCRKHGPTILEGTLSDHLTPLVNLRMQEYKEREECSRSLCMEAFSYPRVNYVQREVMAIGWVADLFSISRDSQPAPSQES